jgi:hypothetical protein
MGVDCFDQQKTKSASLATTSKRTPEIMMSSTRRSTLLFLTVFTLLLAVQLACGAEAAAPGLPAVVETRVAQPTQAASVQLPPAVPEARMLTLEYPSAIRAGDSDVVRLTLEVDDLGNLTPTVSVAGNTTQGQVILVPDVYETHNVVAEARLDLAGVDVKPEGLVSEPLLRGKKVTFYWSVQPAEIGHFKGTVWFYLHFVPRGVGEESRQALSAQPIEIDATALLGLKAGWARWLGLAGTFLGTVLGFPFLEQLLLVFWKRIRRAG